MQTRHWKAYLILIPGLIALGCGDDTKKPDAGDGGRIDAMDAAKLDSSVGPTDVSVDRISDLPTSADAPLRSDATLDGTVRDVGTSDSNAGDLPIASDARVDGIRDGGATDGVLRLDGASDARDAPAPLLDTGVPDAAATDGAAVDAPAMGDGAIDDAGNDTSGSNVFVALLSPAQVVPVGNSSATGQAQFELSATGTQLTYHITHNVTDGTQAGLFQGAGGETGPQVFNLTPFGMDMTGTLTLTDEQRSRLASGMLYFEVRSVGQPNGALRGQILRPGETLWLAHFTGAQATPPVTTLATGHAALVLSAEQDSLSYHVVTGGMAATAVRIQTGIAALAGGQVAYSLTPVTTTMDGVLTVGSADVQNLVDRHWYVNVQSTAFPNGELRGQVLMPGETLYSASLEGGSEVPPVTTTATGAAQFVLAADGTTLMYEAVYVGLVASSAHIHIGAVGVSGAVVYPLTLTGTGTGSKGSVTINATDLSNLNAAGYYANAHSTTNPAGEIRGQINRK